MVGKAPSPLAPLCKGELLLQCEALPTIEGLLTEVSEKREGCGRKAIPPVVARIFSGDSTSPLTREARVMVRGEAMDVLLRRLWGWRGRWAIQLPLAREPRMWC